MPQARILAKGCNVTLQGLVSRPEINGCRGVVLSDFDSEKQRWPVCVMKYKGKKEDMLLKPCNLVLLVQSDSGESEVSEISDESGSSSDDDGEGHGTGSYFKCSYKISQNMEHPYRSYSGDPKLSFTDEFFMSQPMSSHQYCHSTACPLRAGISSTSLQHLAAAYRGTKLRSCKKCRTAWYCSHGCQQHDWLHGNHRANCTQFEHACSKMAENAYPEIEEYEEADTDPAFVRKAFRGVKQPIEVSRVCPSRRSAKHFSRITFEEKCTMEFLISCRGMQTMMSDMFYRRANSLPPADADAVVTFPVTWTAYSEVGGFENVNEWVVLAGKFKSWMWRSSNEGLGLNFSESIPAHMCWLNVNVAVRNAIELLQTWEPQEIDNWAMQREATVMVNLIAGFGHQKCFVDEIMTPGALMHSYVLLLLRWAANWKGPATHVWSRMMQALLSALLSGLELSETKHSSRCSPAKVAVLEPACEKFVSILAADVSRLRFYKPTHLKTLPQLMKECSTDKERSRLLLDAENETISFYAEVAGRELRACLRARRHFPSLNLEPLGRLAAFHKNQLLCSGAYKMVGNDPLCRRTRVEFAA